MNEWEGENTRVFLHKNNLKRLLRKKNNNIESPSNKQSFFNKVAEVWIKKNDLMMLQKFSLYKYYPWYYIAWVKV